MTLKIVQPGPRNVLLVLQPPQDQKGRKLRNLILQRSLWWHSAWPLARTLLLAKKIYSIWPVLSRVVTRLDVNTSKNTVIDASSSQTFSGYFMEYSEFQCVQYVQLKSWTQKDWGLPHPPCANNCLHRSSWLELWISSVKLEGCLVVSWWWVLQGSASSESKPLCPSLAAVSYCFFSTRNTTAGNRN